jgi:hypothetical protein
MGLVPDADQRQVKSFGLPTLGIPTSADPPAVELTHDQATLPDHAWVELQQFAQFNLGPHVALACRTANLYTHV